MAGVQVLPCGGGSSCVTKGGGAEFYKHFTLLYLSLMQDSDVTIHNGFKIETVQVVFS